MIEFPLYPLKYGKFMLIDEQDLDCALSYHWTLKQTERRSCYAWRITSRPNSIHIFFHREILSAPAGFEVDHIDGNGLNNTRANLRICTRAENCLNRGAQVNSLTGVKGVRWFKGKYRVRVQAGGRAYCAGSYSNINDAIVAQNETAKRLHGEFMFTQKLLENYP